MPDTRNVGRMPVDMSDFTVRVKRFTPRDPRLGRHVRHDSRSLLFRAPESDLASLVSVVHHSRIPVLDQGDVGACTGFACVKCLTYGALWDGVEPARSTVRYPSTVLSTTNAEEDAGYALGVYSLATAYDPFWGRFPPDDTGSDGLSVAKVAKERGHIAGYTHATSMNAVLTALARQTVIVGTPWREGMYDPTSAGELRPSGETAGGHEYVLDELDVERQRVWMQNSWGAGWGRNGRAWFSWAAFEDLLHDDGDATIFTPLPEPPPEPTTDPYLTFTTVADAWAKVPRSRADNKAMQAAYLEWRKAGSPSR